MLRTFGIILGVVILLIILLEDKFGSLPPDIIVRIKNIKDLEKLRNLIKIAMKAKNLDEVKSAL
ncbi:MAG: hypothetical protein QW046_06280 [Candidatus Micrarchaeaceae archaeon]